MARMFHHFGWPLAMSVSVQITAKDAKDSMATSCATLCYPDAIGSRNIGETLRSVCGSVIVEIHQGFHDPGCGRPGIMKVSVEVLNHEEHKEHEER